MEFLSKFKWLFVSVGGCIIILSNSLGWEFIGLISVIGGMYIKQKRKLI